MSKDTVELYVKSTSNYQKGYPLTKFTLLSPIWQGESLDIPFATEDEGEMETHTVVGWTDLFSGLADIVSCARVRTHDSPSGEGVLIWGGNSGVRILDEHAPVEGWNEHLPRGYGYPFVWIEEPEDLPGEVYSLLFEERSNSL